jgi:UDP-N-acetylglucosamine--N-acetylmuramyl-(pentapeptide) pyrophosphoryl-undecaprenol N-acetylglucosamine transferase
MLLSRSDEPGGVDAGVTNLAAQPPTIGLISSTQGTMRKAFSRKFLEMFQGNLISRLLGFLREVVVASYFGASRATDIFAIAFTIPTLFRRILGEDMVEKAFLPSFRQLIASGNNRRAWVLASRILCLMTLSLLLLMGLCYLLAPSLMRLVGAGLDAEGLHQARIMTYYVLPFMVAIGLASFVGGLLLFLDATVSYSIAPVFLSIGAIGGIVVFEPYVGIYSMAVAFVLGGMLQFLVQIPPLIRASRRSDLGIRFSLGGRGETIPEMGEVGRQSGWILLQSFANKSVEVVERLLASFLVPGSVAALYFAQRLVQLPNAIVGLSVGRAGVTELNDQVQRGDWSAFRTTVVQAIRYNIASMVPLTVFVVALSIPITAVTYKRGAFGASSVEMTSVAFSFYTFGLLGMGLWSLYTRIYPALAKNQVPLYTSLACAVVNVVLDLLLVKTPLKHGGIALGSSLAISLNAWMLFIALNGELRRLGQRGIGWRDLGDMTLATTLASGTGGVISWALFSWFRGSSLVAGLPHLLASFADVVALGLAGGGGILVFLLTLGYWRRFRQGQRRPTDRVILTGGGTGGHVNPALAIAEVVKERNSGARFLYMGVRGKAESVIVTRAGYPIRYVYASAFPGFRPSLALLRFALSLAVGITQSCFWIAAFQPGMIIGTGGYASAPVIFANTLMRALGLSRARVYIHEQNSVPGKLNLVIGRWADKVLLTFPQTKAWFSRNSVVVGYPVRRSVTLDQRSQAESGPSLPIPPGRRVVFVFGGSQGARTVNRALVDALGYLKPRRHELFIIHGVGLMNTPDYRAREDTAEKFRIMYGVAEQEEIASFYYVQDYFHNIGDIYAVSDLVVCRGGAGSLNEISAMGKPALIIPKANLPGEHQIMNARAMRQAGAAEVVYEDTVMEEGVLLEKVEGKELADRILGLLDDAERLATMAACSRAFMRRHALERIAAEIHGTSFPERTADDSGLSHLKPLLTNVQLLRLLERTWEKERGRYAPQLVISDPDDLEYYRHRAASLLTSPRWQERNVGVKLIGLLKHEEKLSSLLHLLSDPTPATWLQSMFGGDYRQVGFIRRNVLAALQHLNRWNREAEDHVIHALADGYYEVRTQAARTLRHFADRLMERDPICERLLSLLRDRSFEVVIEAAVALGAVGEDRRAIEALLNLKEHHYWQVREAALRALVLLVKRDVIHDRRWVVTEVSRFILTMTDFRSHFSIKESYRQLFDLCREMDAKESQLQGEGASQSVEPVVGRERQAQSG